MNIHIWPYNWKWAEKDSLIQHLPNAKQETREYIVEHLDIAKKYNKPIVLEEFGYPRDGVLFPKNTPTQAKDGYFQFVFDQIANEELGNELLVGCNFGAWGGFADLSDDHDFWQKGDDYTGEPAQEPQGLYSVVATDTTVPSNQEDTSRISSLK